MWCYSHGRPHDVSCWAESEYDDRCHPKDQQAKRLIQQAWLSWVCEIFLCALRDTSHAQGYAGNSTQAYDEQIFHAERHRAQGKVEDDAVRWIDAERYKTSHKKE